MIARDPTGPETWLLSLPPTDQQTRWVIAIAVCQVAALALLAPFASTQLVQINGFIPAFDAVIFVADLVTAVLLFSQHAIHRLRALLVLACGYLFSALMIIPHALTFPGAFSPAGLLGAGLQTTAWLYWFWHLLFPLALLGYGLMKDEKPEQSPAQASSLAVIVRSVALVLAFACGLTLLATTGNDYLPALFAGRVSRAPADHVVGAITVLVCVSALAILWLRRRSLFDQWLMVVALAAILEIGLTVVGGRFSLGFYAGRVFSLLTSTIVLVVLLVETMRLYARAESARQLGETFLAEAQQLSRTGSFGWNVSKGEILWSAETYRIFDYEQGTGVTFDTVLQRVHPDDRARVQAAIDRAATDREAFSIEHRLQMPEGSVKHLHIVAHAVVDNPQNLQFAGAVMDVTMAKEAARALKQSETRYQNLFQAMEVSFFELDYTDSRQILRALRDSGVRDFRVHLKENPDVVREIMRAARVVDVNDQTVASFGRGNKEELLTCVEPFWPDESLDDHLEGVLSTLDGKDRFSTETRVRRLDGTIFDARLTLRYITDDKTRGLVGVIDITERKRAENALRESEERFRDYAEIASDWLWETGPDHKLSRLTGNAFGSNPTGRLGTAAWERALDLETEPEKWRDIKATMDAHQSFRDFVYLAAGRDDSPPMYVKASGKPVFGASGEFLGYRGVGTDATAIIRAQEALRESERSLRLIIDTMPALAWSARPDGSAEFFNQQYLDYFGLPAKQLLGWGWTVAVHPDDLNGLTATWQALLAAGKPGEAEARLRRHDGEYRWFLLRATPLRDDDGNIVKWYGFNTDIEDRTRALARLQQMQSDFAHMNRVSIMGELAASLSHEITQPIGSARNNARAAMNFLNKKPPDLGEVKEALDCIVGDADRAGSIIGRIRDQIRKAPPRKDHFNLNAAITEMIGLARSAILRNGVSVQTSLAEQLSPVHGDRVQLQQVVLNLILNAVEAMGSVKAGARELSISTEQDSAGVLVAVRDSGPGIDQTNLERIFEAFYTTKSSGTGMGLAICRSIINAHGGRLWAEANKPHGAVFQFTLPGVGERS